MSTSSKIVPDVSLDVPLSDSSLCVSSVSEKGPKVFNRDDDDDDDDMKGYDHNFVETEKFEYIMPINDTKNFLYDPYVTSAVIFMGPCVGVEMSKAAGMYKNKEWKGICCMYFKSMCCFPWNLCCCWDDLAPCVITEVKSNYYFFILDLCSIHLFLLFKFTFNSNNIIFKTGNRSYPCKEVQLQH